MFVFSASQLFFFFGDFEEDEEKKPKFFLLFCLIGLRKIRALFFYVSICSLRVIGYCNGF